MSLILQPNAPAEAPLPDRELSQTPEPVTGSGGLQPVVRQGEPYQYRDICMAISIAFIVSIFLPLALMEDAHLASVVALVPLFCFFGFLFFIERGRGY